MTYVIYFKTEKGKISYDIFEGNTPSEARHAFKECYRYGNYTIVSILTIEELRKKYEENYPETNWNNFFNNIIEELREN